MTDPVPSERDALLAQRDALAVACELLMKAALFYADPGTYHATGFLFDPPTGGFDGDFDEEYGSPDYERPMPGKLARWAARGAVAIFEEHQLFEDDKRLV